VIAWDTYLEVYACNTQRTGHTPKLLAGLVGSFPLREGAPLPHFLALPRVSSLPPTYIHFPHLLISSLSHTIEHLSVAMATTTQHPPPVAPPTATPSVIGRNKSVGWYVPTLENITEAQRDLLENYSHIPPERVIPHILEVVSYHLHFRHPHASHQANKQPIARESLGDLSIPLHWTVSVH